MKPKKKQPKPKEAGKGRGLPMRLPPASEGRFLLRKWVQSPKSTKFLEYAFWRIAELVLGILVLMILHSA